MSHLFWIFLLKLVQPNCLPDYAEVCDFPTEAPSAAQPAGRRGSHSAVHRCREQRRGPHAGRPGEPTRPPVRTPGELQWPF
eukprot:scaffold342812_cov35-Prasinocladus_malaysianus.AAC.1